MSSSRRVPLRSSLAIASLTWSLLALSCKDKPAENTVGAATTTPPAATSVAAAGSTPAPTAAADGGREAGDRRGGHGGPGAALFQAARGIELTDAQKQKIDAAEKAAHEGAGEASRTAMKDATKDLHTDLIAGIKAGKIETAKLEPRYAAIDKVAAAAQQKEIEALTALHGALEPAQRKAVTASVRAKQEKREDRREDMRERKNEHIKNVVEAGGPADAGFGLGGSKRGLDRLTRGIELAAEQQKKVDALAAKEDAAGGDKAGRDPEEMHKHMEALLVAFEKDTFDAKKLEVFDAKKARAPMEQETKLLAQLLPILEPEQREKLAARMEKGPSPHGGRRGGAFGARGPSHAPGDEN